DRHSRRQSCDERDFRIPRVDSGRGRTSCWQNEGEGPQAMEYIMSAETMSPELAPAASAPMDRSTAARNRLVIALLLISTFVVFLNETIMSVAIPHLMTDLGVTASAAQWLTTAFLLTMAVVIPITGFLL